MHSLCNVSNTKKDNPHHGTNEQESYIVKELVMALVLQNITNIMVMMLESSKIIPGKKT